MATRKKGSSDNGRNPQQQRARDEQERLTAQLSERADQLAGHAEDLVAGIPESRQEPACLLELVGPRSLREIAADDDQVGPFFINPSLDRFDQLLIVGAEMQVGQMDQASHGSPTRVTVTGSLIDSPGWIERRPIAEPGPFPSGCGSTKRRSNSGYTSISKAFAGRSKSLNSRVGSPIRLTVWTAQAAPMCFAGSRRGSFFPERMRSNANIGCWTLSGGRVSPCRASGRSHAA